MSSDESDLETNDARSIHGSDSPDRSYDSRSDQGQVSEDDDEVDTNGLDPAHNSLLGTRSCRDHETDYASECSECVDIQRTARDYSQHLKEDNAEDKAGYVTRFHFLSCLLHFFCLYRNQQDQAESGSEADDKIPTLLQRHVRTDKKKDTLHLEPQVIDLARQRLAEGRYESTKSFSKLVDKKLRLSEDAHKVLSATKVEPILKALRNRRSYQWIFNLERGLSKIHQDIMMALRPVLKIQRYRPVCSPSLHWILFSFFFQQYGGPDGQAETPGEKHAGFYLPEKADFHYHLGAGYPSGSSPLPA